MLWIEQKSIGRVGKHNSIQLPAFDCHWPPAIRILKRNLIWRQKIMVQVKIEQFDRLLMCQREWNQCSIWVFNAMWPLPPEEPFTCLVECTRWQIDMYVCLPFSLTHFHFYYHSFCFWNHLHLKGLRMRLLFPMKITSCILFEQKMKMN